MVKDENLVCPGCGALNRLPGDKDSLKAKCGKCGQPLFRTSPPDIDTSMFERQRAKTTLPLVVDVWAPWCGPCRAMAPEYEKAATAIQPSAYLVKLNSDANPQLSARLGIRGIPTMIAFRDGLEVARQAGALSSSQIVSWVNAQLR